MVKGLRSLKPGASGSSGRVTPTEKREEDGDDEDDDDGDDECDDPITAATKVMDTCLASHEFEWLTPVALVDATDPLEINTETRVNPSVIPLQQPQHKSRKSGTYRQRRVKERDCPPCQMSPTPCYDNHVCRHRLSPMRSSWCCPSPPPPPPHVSPYPVCLHHSGGSITGMELLPYGQECYPEDTSCMACYTGHQHVCHCSPRHRYNSPHFTECCTPASPQKTCRNSGQRSHSLGTPRMREFSPSSSPLHRPYYTNEVSHLILPSQNINTWDEQWKPPTHAGDTNSVQKIQHLESEKKNLLLQVSVLNDQVEAQTDKIRELESVLIERKEQLKQMDKNLHSEVMSRAALENSKLELMTELSSLRLRLTASEQDRRDSDERCRKIEADLRMMYERFELGESDGRSSLRRKILRNGTLVSAERNTEVEKLQAALESVIASNEEKDKKIDDLRLALVKYRKLQDYVLVGHQRKASDVKDGSLNDIEGCQDGVPPPSPGSDSFRLQGRYAGKPPSGLSSLKSLKSDSQMRDGLSKSSAPEFDTRSTQSVILLHKCSSLENVRGIITKTPSPKNSYSTIPRQNGPQVLQHLQEHLQILDCNADDTMEGPQMSPSPSITSKKQKKLLKEQAKELNRNARNKSTGVSFGKGFFKLRSGKRSSSAPHLAPFESIVISPIERNALSACPTPQPTMQPFFLKPEKEKNKGLLKFFTKWKRSGSQNIEKIEGDFRRGGIRATAAPRLGWSRDISLDLDIPFSNWNNDVLVEWFHKIGLSMYIAECRRWKCNGEQLLNATANEIEKELNIKNQLHKKKLSLALQGFKSVDKLPSSIINLDYLWVTRWLDDVGLPQYKDSFMEARVDGRVLHYLTVDDLIYLKVTNQLHHISIKRGIQILREKNFDSHCLVRRSVVDEDKNYVPESVALWTNHRVMEWLRTVDLSEYAPNLRGSGVHGALIVYEDKFNTDLFATLLNIPPNKTLLRRHLATHFKSIVGANYAQAKRDVEDDQLFMPLSPNVKIKGVRKPQFVLKKKKSKGDMDKEEFVCPMDIPVGSTSTNPSTDKLVVRRNSDPASHEARLFNEEDDKTTTEIGAVSEEITSLTDMLQAEKLENTPTSNV